MAELKPCPFCGGQAEVKNVSKTGKPHWCVICCACGARGRETKSFGTANTKDKKKLAYFENEGKMWAIQAWNRRAEAALGGDTDG